MGNHQSDQHESTEMFRNMILIWLDTNIDHTKKHYHDTVNVLRNTVDTIKLYTDSKLCKEFITDLTNEKVFILISGSVGEHVMPFIHDMTQVNSIFVYCVDRNKHKQWADQWPKIRGVYTAIKPICQILERIKALHGYNNIPMSFLTINDDNSFNQNWTNSFAYTQMVKEILLAIPFERKHLTEFVHYCRTLLIDNEEQLKNLVNFEKYYYEKGPIWWFTCDCFLKSMLTYALREMDVELTIKMGFFIRHLHEQIKELYFKQFSTHDLKNTLVVYRGQGMTKEDFHRMKTNKGKLVSFNSFLLTSQNPAIPLDLAQYVASNPNLVGVFFRMTVDPSKLALPLAFITDITGNKEKDDVLFSLNTVFRISYIEPMDQEHRVYQVHMEFINGQDENLRLVTNHIRQETFPEQEGWVRLNSLLSKKNLSVSIAEIYEIRLELTVDEKEQAFLYDQLGRIKYCQGEYLEALTFYERTLKIQQQLLPIDDQQLAASYSEIGNVYLSLDEYATALTFYDKALEINQKSASPDHLTIASLYNNIGLAHYYLADYDKACSFHTEALKIRQQFLPSNHLQLASSYHHIGETYFKMEDYWTALTYYDKSLEIKMKALKTNHADIAYSYNNIGEMYSNIGQYKNAIAAYEKALNIFERLLLTKRHDLVESYNKIGSLYDKLGETSEARSFYELASNLF